MGPAVDFYPAPPTSFVLASGSRHKLAEFTALLAPHGLAVSPPPPGFTCAETAATFAGNAKLKAEAAAWARNQAQLPPAWVLADDSGLVVDALDGAPGIYSARYAPKVAADGDQDAANRAKLLAAMAGVASERRRARFVCALVALAPTATGADRTRGDGAAAAGRCVEGYGELLGWIAPQARGAQGFGYDAIFVPQSADGRPCPGTLAELGPAVKDALSHRARALAALLAGLRSPTTG